MTLVKEIFSHKKVKGDYQNQAIFSAETVRPAKLILKYHTSCNKNVSLVYNYAYIFDT